MHRRSVTRNLGGHKVTAKNLWRAPPLELLLFLACPIENSKIFGGIRAPPPKCMDGPPMWSRYKVHMSFIAKWSEFEFHRFDIWLIQMAQFNDTKLVWNTIVYFCTSPFRGYSKSCLIHCRIARITEMPIVNEWLSRVTVTSALELTCSRNSINCQNELHE